VDSEPRNDRAITRGRPFQPGNPGKPRGARHRTTVAIEALLEGQHEQLTKAAIDKALEGDTVALRLCLDRLAPPRRDAPVSFEMPPIETVADTVLASSAVLAAVAAGDITPDEGGRIMALLSAHRGILETGQMEARIAALEARGDAS
jgi:hypothetical protein